MASWCLAVACCNYHSPFYLLSMKCQLRSGPEMSASYLGSGLANANLLLQVHRLSSKQQYMTCGAHWWTWACLWSPLLCNSCSSLYQQETVTDEPWSFYLRRQLGRCPLDCYHMSAALWQLLYMVRELVTCRVCLWLWVSQSSWHISEHVLLLKWTVFLWYSGCDKKWNSVTEHKRHVLWSTYVYHSAR